MVQLCPCLHCGGLHPCGLQCPNLETGLPKTAPVLAPPVFPSVPSIASLPARPKGCICPPGANRDCEAWDCPRKTPKPEIKP